jgi:hypothetical protein
MAGIGVVPSTDGYSKAHQQAGRHARDPVSAAPRIGGSEEMATEPDMQRSGLGKKRLVLVFAAIAVLAAAAVFIVVMIVGNGQDDQHEPQQRGHALTAASASVR